jgi:hypothetical protein
MPLIPQPIVFQPAPVDNQPAQVQNVPYYDVQWNRPVFRPPSLPTQSQIWGEIPFTTRLRGPVSERK